jgi:hypothetical protein
MKVTSTIKNAYTCYQENFYEKKMESSVQTSLDSYFKKPLPVQSNKKSHDSQSTNQSTNFPVSRLLHL